MAAVKVRLVKWGKSHAVRIPKVILDQGNIREGDQLEIRVGGGCIVLERATPKNQLDDLLARITPKNCHAEQDWGRLKGREVW